MLGGLIGQAPAGGRSDQRSHNMPGFVTGDRLVRVYAVQTDVLRGPHAHRRVIDPDELPQPSQLIGLQRRSLGQASGQPPLGGVGGESRVPGSP